MACQIVLDYFIPRGLEILFIVRTYLNFCVAISLECFFAHGPTEYE